MKTQGSVSSVERHLLPLADAVQIGRAGLAVTETSAAGGFRPVFTLPWVKAHSRDPIERRDAVQVRNPQKLIWTRVFQYIDRLNFRPMCARK